jgi:AraC family transcriptional regulator
MRARNRVSYAERIERAIALLEQNTVAGKSTPLCDLASAAALSTYHFHRVFRVMTGEAVGTVVARVRLGGALPSLNHSLSNAVDKSGYATGQAFARAVKDRTGATPSALRDNPSLRKEAERSLAVPNRSATSTPPLTIEIVCVDPLRLATIRNVGDYAELNHGFSQLFECVAQQVGHETITGLYGVPHDDPREVQAQACRFDCAVSISVDLEPNKPVCIAEFSGGSALRMVHLSDYDQIHALVDALYFKAITANLCIANTPLLIHYLDDPEEVAVEELVAHVFLWLDEPE